jgi:DNA-binding Lrp family transcriptional regulator
VLFIKDSHKQNDEAVQHLGRRRGSSASSPVRGGWTYVVPSDVAVDDGGDRRERGMAMVEAYVLIQTQVGRSAEVADAVGKIPGVHLADAVAGPYDVVVRAEAADINRLGKLIVAKLQAVVGVTRTLTCPVVHL